MDNRFLDYGSPSVRPNREVESATSLNLFFYVSGSWGCSCVSFMDNSPLAVELFIIRNSTIVTSYLFTFGMNGSR